MRITITDWIHDVLRGHIKEGDFCIDATKGKGNDTLFLCRMAGKDGKVAAFDIQQTALDLTRKKLQQNGCRAELYLKSHEFMAEYFDPETVQCIMFNLGYLPGGDHSLATRPEGTIAAVKAGLTLLKPGGIMSICIYSGGDSGFEERDEVLKFLGGLDDRKYFIAAQEFLNKRNHPPMPVFIVKL